MNFGLQIRKLESSSSSDIYQLHDWEIHLTSGSLSFLTYVIGTTESMIYSKLSYIVWSVIKWKVLLLLQCALTEHNLIFIMVLESTLAGENVSPHVRKMGRAISNIKLYATCKESRIQKMNVPHEL